MLTKAQRDQQMMLEDAITALPRDHRIEWLVSILGDHLTGAELEAMGDRIGLQGHMKARTETSAVPTPEKWGSGEIHQYTHGMIAEGECGPV